jgi:hypothetical protein
MTDFTIVYKRFYSKITDDMYMELDEAETDALLEELLINAIPWFEFPRVNLNDYDILRQRFKADLSNDEINVLATYMVVGWLDQQLASIENVRMKYTGSDFKMTSQANHMSKLMALRKEYERIGFHLQRVYKRRKVDKDGKIRSTFGSIMSSSVRGGNVPTNNNSSADSGGGNESEEDGDNWEDMDDILVNKPSNGTGSWDEMEDLPNQNIPSQGGQDEWEGLNNSLDSPWGGH